MKKATKLLGNILIAGFLPLLTLGSCISEKEIYPSSEGDETMVTFSIQVPGKNAPASRAMTEGQENDVKTMDILVFVPGGEYVYTARCSGTDITTDGSNVRKKSFTVKLRRGTFDLVLLGNARDLTGVSFDGKNKTAALAMIEAQVSGKWLADGSRSFPMWGEKSGVTIDDDTDLTGSNGISLARMVARVDVQITGTATGTFELSSVHVYNYNTHGSIAPATGQWNPGGPNFETNPPKATAPNVPSSSTLNKGPLLYNGAEVTATGCASEIYIFEAENHTGTVHTTAKGLLDRTCLVIGGVYDTNGNGIFTDDGDPTYYRVDFSTGSGVSQAYLDVLRNHQYIFSITKVSGAGYETPQIAFESGPVNIEANVLQWNDGGVGDIKFDGQYMLSIRPGSEFEFYKESGSQSATITTDYPGGWEVLKITELGSDNSESDISSGGWLTTDQIIGAVYGDGIPAELGINVSINTTEQLRTGFIYIKAGRLELRLTITQSNDVFSFLSITNEEGALIDAIEFGATLGGDPGEYTYKVKWSPQAEALYSSVTPVAMSGGNYTYPEWAYYGVFSGSLNEPSGTDIYVTPITTGTGEAVFTIKPTPIQSGDMGGDPFYERQISMNYRVNGSLGMLRKQLLLQQFVFNLTAQTDNFYLADGELHSFNVKSNRPWKAYLIDDGDGIVAAPEVSSVIPFATGGYNLPDGINVSFRTLNDIANPTKIAGTAKVRIDWQNGPSVSDISSETIELFCAAGRMGTPSNCYMLEPNGLPVLIPIDRANGLIQLDGETRTYQPGWTLGKQIPDAPTVTNYTAELIWSDVKGFDGNGLSPDGSTPVKMILPIGTHSQGYLLVMPGNVTGNAVIALKNEAGTSNYWSWHIWVTSYNPYDAAGNAVGIGIGSRWMDRNVGALNNTVGNAGSTGMHYQWGRKDPFQGTPAFIYSSQTPKPMYSAAGVQISPPVERALNLSTSLQYPYTMASAWTIPYSTETWGNTGVKSAYDPCPEGWRVPKSGTTVAESPWASVTIASGGAFYSNYGYIWNDVGGYYPAAGYRNSASIPDSKEYAYYWSAGHNGTQGISLMFNRNSTLSVAQPYAVTLGFPVRCVKE